MEHPKKGQILESYVFITMADHALLETKLPGRNLDILLSKHCADAASLLYYSHPGPTD